MKQITSRTFLFFILWIPILLVVSCSTQKNVHPEETSWEPTTKALLWKLEKKSFETSYLFGTIHLIDKEDYFLPGELENSMSGVSRIVFEIDIKEMSNIGLQLGLLTKSFMKNNTTLSDLLSESDYQLVADHFEDMGLPMLFLERIKPLFLSILADGELDPMALQNGDFLSYELELNQMAEMKGKETGGLETMEYQFGLFDSIPYKDQAEMLVESIKGNSESDSMLDELVRQYKSQDLKLMHDYTLTEESGMLKHADILLYNRNRNWIPVMKDFMKRESVFFAVGAGHLGGQKGVLALLRKEGFNVTPLN